jgi:hypothetical protein
VEQVLLFDPATGRCVDVLGFLLRRWRTLMKLRTAWARPTREGRVADAAPALAGELASVRDARAARLQLTAGEAEAGRGRCRRRAHRLRRCSGVVQTTTATSASSTSHGTAVRSALGEYA